MCEEKFLTWLPLANHGWVKILNKQEKPLPGEWDLKKSHPAFPKILWRVHYKELLQLGETEMK